MPGTPATSPRVGAPRYADSDPATFSAQVNAVTDMFDSKVALSTDTRLTDQRTPLDGSVTNAKLAAAAVTGAKIAATTITESNMAASSIGAPEIIDGSVGTAELASGSVTSAKLAASAVTAAAIAAGIIDSTKLVSAVVQALNAPGDLVVSAASTRAGCLLCDGSAQSRTTYAALFAAIGTAFGTGDGSTTFNLPDYRGRTIVGAGTGTGLSARALAAKGGEEAHTLSNSELPAHNHGGATGTGSTGTGSTGTGATGGGTTGVDSPDHAHGAGYGGFACVDGSYMAAAVWNNPQAGHTLGLFANNASFQGATVGANARHQHSVPSLSVPSLSVPSLSVPSLSVNSDGGSAAHNTMPPYAVANVFIKT